MVAVSGVPGDPATWYFGGVAGGVWKSQKLSKILDVAVGADPKGTKKTGFFVLQATGADGKGRTVEFFALD